jgi:hypothetical protein
LTSIGSSYSKVATRCQLAHSCFHIDSSTRSARRSAAANIDRATIVVVADAECLTSTDFYWAPTATTRRKYGRYGFATRKVDVSTSGCSGGSRPSEEVKVATIA